MSTDIKSLGSFIWSIAAAVTGHIDAETSAKSDTRDRRLDAIQEEMGA